MNAGRKLVRLQVSTVMQSATELVFDHAASILILAQSNKLRMPQTIAFGPFQEFNLRYEFGIDPNTLLHLLRCQSFTPSRLSRFWQVDGGTSTLARGRSFSNTWRRDAGTKPLCLDCTRGDTAERRKALWACRSPNRCAGIKRISFYLT